MIVVVKNEQARRVLDMLSDRSDKKCEELNNYINQQILKELGFVKYDEDGETFYTYNNKKYFGVTITNQYSLEAGIDDIILEVKVLSKWSEAIKPEETELRKAVKLLTKEIRHDEELYYAYQANIAMAFVDNFRWFNDKAEVDLECGKVITICEHHIHTIANNAAKYFLNLWVKEN